MQTLTFVLLALYAGWLPELRHFRLFRRFWRPDWQALHQVFRLGWPIGVTSLAESGLFQATALDDGMDRHGRTCGAWHHHGSRGLVFHELHLGLSNAATVRAGRADGAGDRQGMRDAAKVAIALSGGFGLVMIALFLSLPVQIISLFLDETKPQSAEYCLWRHIAGNGCAVSDGGCDAGDGFGLAARDQGYPGADDRGGGQLLGHRDSDQGIFWPSMPEWAASDYGRVW